MRRLVPEMMRWRLEEEKKPEVWRPFEAIALAVVWSVISGLLCGAFAWQSGHDSGAKTTSSYLESKHRGDLAHESAKAWQTGWDTGRRAHGSGCSMDPIQAWEERR